jgi:hypothetical protein
MVFQIPWLFHGILGPVLERKKKEKSLSLINLQILDKNLGFVCSKNSWATVTTTTTSNIISLLKLKP